MKNEGCSFKAPIHCHSGYCCMTVSDQLPWEQAYLDFSVGQCLVSDENTACWIPIRHNTLSDGDVKVDLSYDGV